MARQGVIPRTGICVRCGGERPAPSVKWMDKRQPNYWSATEFNSNNAWNFNFNNGNQNANNKNNQLSAWAVRPG